MTARQFIQNKMGTINFDLDINLKGNTLVKWMEEYMQYKNERREISNAIDWWRCLTEQRQYQYMRKFCDHKIDLPDLKSADIHSIYSKWRSTCI